MSTKVTWENPSVPFVASMNTASLNAGTNHFKNISIQGHAPKGASRFSIYLQKGSEYEPSDIAFVFDARFDSYGDRNKIVTNDKRNGRQGREDGRVLLFPFEIEKEFEITIIVECNSFKVNVNGNALLVRSQEVPYFDNIRIDNEVILTKVVLE